MEHTFTLGGLIILITLVGGIVGLYMQFRKVKRENEADGRARTEELKADFRAVHTTISERLTKVEVKINDFMPRGEIEQKIEHEKANRTLADDQLRRITDNLGRDVRDIMIGQSKIEQQHHDTSSAVAEIKDTLKDLSREIGARFDKVSTAISGLTSGHRVKGQIDH